MALLNKSFLFLRDHFRNKFFLRSFRFLLLLLSSTLLISCQANNLRPYRTYPVVQQRQIDRICAQAEGTHFIVEDRQVRFRSNQSGAQLPLHHYKSYLPNGYYFCTGVDPNSSVLE